MIQVMIVLAALFSASREMIDLGWAPAIHKWYRWKIRGRIDAFHTYPALETALITFIGYLSPNVTYLAITLITFYQIRNIWMHLILPRKPNIPRRLSPGQTIGAIAGTLALIWWI